MTIDIPTLSCDADVSRYLDKRNILLFLGPSVNRLATPLYACMQYRKKGKDLFSWRDAAGSIRQAEMRAIYWVVCYEEYSNILQGQNFFTPFRRTSLHHSTTGSQADKGPPSKTAGYSGNDLNLISPYPLFQRGNPAIKLRAGLNGFPVAS
jgi:hypothetical protein